jgi:hypothetical protein
MALQVQKGVMIPSAAAQRWAEKRLFLSMMLRTFDGGKKVRSMDTA